MHSLSEWLADGLLVSLGATLGTPARFFISGVVARRFGETIPWGTLVVNVTGCLVMGLVAAVALARGLAGGSAFWLVGATGFLGSYTTASSFALQTRALLRDGEARLALSYVGLSLALGLAAVASGFELGRLILGAVS